MARREQAQQAFLPAHADGRTDPETTAGRVADHQRIAGTDFAGGMIMLRLYWDILVFGVSVCIFTVLAVAAVQGHAVTWKDFIFPIAIQVLLTSLVFILRELLRRYNA